MMNFFFYLIRVIMKFFYLILKFFILYARITVHN